MFIYIIYLFIKTDNVKASQAVGSRSKGIIKLLIIPSAFVVGAVITATSNFWASLDPTLEPHLREVTFLISDGFRIN